MLYLSTSCIKADSVIDSIVKLSFITKNIELSGGNKYQEDVLEKINELTNDNYNFLVHNYFPAPVNNFVLNFANTSDKTRNFIRQSMQYVKKLGISYYSIHAGFKKDFQIKNEILGDGKGCFVVKNIQENINWFYSNYIEKLALENLFPNGQNETCFASHIDEIVELLKSDTRVFLLLDLGHLKISSKFYGFDYLEAVSLLFEKYSHRILEIHLSENNGVEDNHFIIQANNIQYMILKKFKKYIIENNINLVIEARGYSLEKLKECYNLIQKIGEKK
jgi:uncharacterized protein (UPF0276 family)